jgi:molybdenum cofactor synthesis domain-containing protein
MNDTPHIQNKLITAAILVIGDEILSGRTKDKNIGYIADYCTNIGIDLKEVRVVPDEEAEIVAALNALRARYTYVFTTGGIGPTHDDITAECVAKAFGVAINEDPRALALMMQRYKPEDLNAARRRMARIPEGADLVLNPISQAPGFRIGNVIVMAGVPMVMQAMLDNVGPTLNTGVKMLSETIEANGLPEGIYGGPLGEIAARHPNLSIGSYPSFKDGKFANQIVVRGRDETALEAGLAEVRQMLQKLEADRNPL